MKGLILSLGLVVGGMSAAVLAQQSALEGDRAGNRPSIHYNVLEDEKQEFEDRLDTVEAQSGGISFPALPGSLAPPGSPSGLPLRPNGCVANKKIYPIGKGYSVGGGGGGYGDLNCACGCTVTVTDYTCITGFVWSVHEKQEYYGGWNNCEGPGDKL